MVRYPGMNCAINEVADRWERGSGALLAESQPCGYHLAAMVNKHGDDSMALFDDPLEAALFIVLVEFINENWSCGNEIVADESSMARHGFW